MKKLIIITLLITVAAVIKRVKRKFNKQVAGRWSDGPTLHAVIR